MHVSSLESKTIRPGSLGSYSYYHSNRRPAAQPPRASFIAASRFRLIPRSKAVLVIAVIALVGLPMLLSYRDSANKQPAASQTATPAAPTPQKSASSNVPTTALSAAALKPTASTDHCAGNTEEKLILVSVSKRHLWACAGSKTVHESAVITGMLAHDSTVTPVGTYHIYSKATDTTLSGTDETGSWNDPVYYWMPFLDNQYGTYGFHDATWRADSSFGKVDPNSADASHGCVELPLGTSKWLYNWAPSGTTVTVES